MKLSELEYYQYGHDQILTLSKNNKDQFPDTPSNFSQEKKLRRDFNRFFKLQTFSNQNIFDQEKTQNNYRSCKK